MLVSFIYFITCLFMAGHAVLYPEEYCSGETFSANCERNEVVVIKDANYGRMRMGRCVKTDFGKIKSSNTETITSHNIILWILVFACVFVIAILFLCHYLSNLHDSFRLFGMFGECAAISNKGLLWKTRL